MYKIRVDYAISKIGMCRATLSVIQADADLNDCILKDSCGIRKAKLVTAEKFTWDAVEEDVARYIENAREAVQQRRERIDTMPNQATYIL